MSDALNPIMFPGGGEISLVGCRNKRHCPDGEQWNISIAKKAFLRRDLDDVDGGRISSSTFSDEASKDASGDQTKGTFNLCEHESTVTDSNTSFGSFSSIVQGNSTEASSASASTDGIIPVSSTKDGPQELLQHPAVTVHLKDGWFLSSDDVVRSSSDAHQNEQTIITNDGLDSPLSASAIFESECSEDSGVSHAERVKRHGKRPAGFRKGGVKGAQCANYPFGWQSPGNSCPYSQSAVSTNQASSSATKPVRVRQEDPKEEEGNIGTKRCKLPADIAFRDELDPSLSANTSEERGNISEGDGWWTLDTITRTGESGSEEEEEEEAEEVRRPSVGKQETCWHTDCKPDVHESTGLPSQVDLRCKTEKSKSDTVLPSYVLSSGRLSLQEEAQLGRRVPTIDEDFEQYFSALML